MIKLNGIKPSLIAVTLVFLSASAHAEIYKWTDENGRTHFSDKPPASAKSEKVEVKITTYSAPPVVESFQSRPSSKKKKAGSKKVVMYSTEWCGVCKRAKAYFKQKGIRYKEYDVEKSQKGKKDYKRLNGRGVPIILVGGKKMVGFSPSGFEALLASDGS